MCVSNRRDGKFVPHKGSLAMMWLMFGIYFATGQSGRKSCSSLRLVEIATGDTVAIVIVACQNIGTSSDVFAPKSYVFVDI